MKKVLMLAIVMMTMLVTLGGCYWGYPGGGRGDGHDDHNRNERQHDHDRDRDGGGQYDRR